MNDLLTALCGMTGFGQFQWYSVDGLWRLDGENVDVLAIYSDDEGKRHCSRFLDWLLANYERVRFLHVESEKLAGMLRRRGFKEVQWFEADELVTGMVWYAQT